MFSERLLASLPATPHLQAAPSLQLECRELHSIPIISTARAWLSMPSPSLPKAPRTCPPAPPSSEYSAPASPSPPPTARRRAGVGSPCAGRRGAPRPVGAPELGLQPPQQPCGRLLLTHHLQPLPGVRLRRDQALSSHCKPRPSREAGGTLASLHYTGRKSYPPPSTLAHSCRSSVLSRPSPPQSSTALLQVPSRAAPVALLPP